MMQDINLKLTLNANGSITANWTVLPGMVKQEVYVKQVGKSYGVESNKDWHGSSYTTKPNLPANAQYDFSVSEIGEHAAIGADVQRILIRSDFYDNKPLEVPQNIKIVPLATQIGVSFDAVPRAKSYDFLFDNKVYSETRTYKHFTGLKPKTSHTVSVHIMPAVTVHIPREKRLRQLRWVRRCPRMLQHRQN